MASTEKPAKRPVGRPSKYEPDLSARRVIELGDRASPASYIACESECIRGCLEDGKRDHPEFSDAMGEARRHSQHWWEDSGTEGMLAGPGSFNAAIWSR